MCVLLSRLRFLVIRWTTSLYFFLTAVLFLVFSPVMSLISFSNLLLSFPLFLFPSLLPSIITLYNETSALIICSNISVSLSQCLLPVRGVVWFYPSYLYLFFPFKISLEFFFILIFERHLIFFRSALFTVHDLESFCTNGEIIHSRCYLTFVDRKRFLYLINSFNFTFNNLPQFCAYFFTAWIFI